MVIIFILIIIFNCGVKLLLMRFRSHSVCMSGSNTDLLKQSVCFDTQERMNHTLSITRIIHMAGVSCYLYHWARG